MSEPNPADTYFSTRYGASAAWSALSESDKTALLTTAENDLVAVYGSVPETDAGQRCIYEQAFFRMLDADVDTRSALQAQGVSAAGIAKESYRAGGGIAVCAYAQQVLGPAGSGIALGAVAVDLESDENVTYYNVD